MRILERFGGVNVIVGGMGRNSAMIPLLGSPMNPGIVTVWSKLKS